MNKALVVGLFLACMSLSCSLVESRQCQYDVKYINENSTDWPFERYGKIFNVDYSTQHFDFVKNSVFDDVSVLGRSRNCITWSDSTAFVKVQIVKDLTGLKKPVIVKLLATNAREAGKLAQGVAFQAKTATVLFDVKNVSDIKTGKDEIVALFTPDGPRSGTIQINSKPVKVSIAKRRFKIMFVNVVDASAIKTGFWSARISGAENKSVGAFVATRVELSALPDPTDDDDPKLPRLLVIGDSVSMNYESSAMAALKGVVNYHRCEGNSYSSNYGVQYADYWLGNYSKKGFQWDVIQFNHGLHDLKQAGPSERYATPLESYKSNLRKEIAILKKSGAKLIFCTTTPVPRSSSGRYGRQKGSEVAFNKAALEVVSEYPEIQVTDLCKAVKDSSVFDKFRKGWDVHYYKEVEQKVLGDTVAAGVRRALEK